MTGAALLAIRPIPVEAAVVGYKEPVSDEPIFHLALPDEWAAAVATGSYERSTRGRSLADEGFVHASFRHQLAGVANGFYADLDELVLLEIDPAALGAEVRLEPIPSGAEFPHVYGPIPLAAVASTTIMRRVGEQWSFD